MSEYEHNFEWSKIPKDAKVYDLGSSYVVHMPDGRKGLIFWDSHNATKAVNWCRKVALPKSAISKT